MKTMTCNQLGGACDQEFHAESFDEIARQSQDHAHEMFDKNDIPHLEAMSKMAQLMEYQEAMQGWMEQKMREFELLPEYA